MSTLSDSIETSSCCTSYPLFGVPRVLVLFHDTRLGRGKLGWPRCHTSCNDLFLREINKSISLRHFFIISRSFSLQSEVSNSATTEKNAFERGWAVKPDTAIRARLAESSSPPTAIKDAVRYSRIDTNCIFRMLFKLSFESVGAYKLNSVANMGI